MNPDVVEESAAAESVELSSEDTVERVVRRVMEASNIELRNEIGNLREDIVELRQLIETVSTDVRTLVKDPVSPIGEKVRDLESGTTNFSDPKNDVSSSPWLQMDNQAVIDGVLRNMGGYIGPVPRQQIDIAARAVCRIELISKKRDSWRKQGSGFLVEVQLNYQHNLKGLLTNNHVINKYDYNNESLSCELIFEGLQNEKKEELRVQLPFEECKNFFTSDKKEMDATFIQISETLIDNLTKRNAVWLKIHHSDANKAETIFILQHPAIIAKSAAALGIGRVMELYESRSLGEPPFKILKHSADTTGGSSGSPVMNFNGELIGLHRCAFRNGYNGATSAYSIRNAMISSFKDGQFSTDPGSSNNEIVAPEIEHVEPIGRFKIEREKEGVAGVAWFEKKIYVICWIPEPRKIHVYHDEDPFGEVEEITDGLKGLVDPYDMHISETHRAIFIVEYRNKYIFKINIDDKSVSKHRIEWKPRGMSLTLDHKLLVAVWKDRTPKQYFLDIYDYDNGVMKKKDKTIYLSPEVSMSPPEGVTRIDHAVQSPKLPEGHFIVSFENTVGRYVLSEMSIYESDGTAKRLRILRTFVPTTDLVDWFPYDLAIDRDGRILISDYAADGGRRVFQLNPEMTRLSLLLDLTETGRPSRLCYLQEDQRMLLGFDTASVSVFKLNQE